MDSMWLSHFRSWEMVVPRNLNDSTAVTAVELIQIVCLLLILHSAGGWCLVVGYLFQATPMLSHWKRIGFLAYQNNSFLPLWSPFPVCIWPVYTRFYPPPYKHLLWLLECLCFPRTLRQVKDRSQDKLLQDEEVLRSLVCLFTQLLKHDLKNQRDLPQSTHSIEANVPDERSAVMLNTLGFSVERKRSSLQFAGNGVFVTQGRAPKGTIVAMYPGILYNVTVTIQFILNT